MPGLQLEYTGLGCCAGRAAMMERKEEHMGCCEVGLGWKGLG